MSRRGREGGNRKHYKSFVHWKPTNATQSGAYMLPKRTSPTKEYCCCSGIACWKTIASVTVYHRMAPTSFLPLRHGMLDWDPPRWFCSGPAHTGAMSSLNNWLLPF